MNYDVNALLERLKNGEDAEALAQSLISNLNEAIKLNDAEIQKQKELEREKELAAAREAELMRQAQIISDAIIAYVQAGYPALAEVLGDETLDPSSVRESLDAALKIVDASSLFIKELGATAPKATPKATSSPDDAISQFLKLFVD
jgi:F0F1-type ATP synthase membrane subunit b/b'